ncbi:hypothetical protein EYR36_004011 [Pleurotus pulmonarius]|nr:hypothetical protein EYR36_004011 [Pleurotus pulmonarius]
MANSDNTSDITDELLAQLDEETTISQIVITYLQRLSSNDDGCRIHEAVEALLHALSNHRVSESVTRRWACETASSTYASEILALSKKESGLHFGASSARADQLNDFDLDGLATQFQATAPNLWRCYKHLLAADPATTHLRERREQRRMDTKAAAREAVRLRYNLQENELDEDSDSDNEDDPLLNDRASKARESTMNIRKVVLTSIMLQSTNQFCNALQSVMGVFLHSCNAPEDIIEVLARMGVSISTTSINDAISSLSKESSNGLKTLGRTLTASFAYDNVDIELKHTVPTLEKPHETLVHLTSGTLIPLDHGVAREDLSCSEELWERSAMNPARAVAVEPTVSEDELLKLHQEADFDSSGLLRRGRFNAWVFRRDLVNHGPLFFRRYMKDLGAPEVVDQIPVTKSVQVPARMMDISPSTPQGNGDALADLFRQANIGDPTEKGCDEVADIKNYVVLVHGDLLTGERIQSFQASRRIEKTPWRRNQFLIYVMGLFHLKMACADAIWRICIFPKSARNDPSSLIKFVGILRKKETAKIETKPGFRRMHEVIEHVGIVSRLNSWKAVVSKHYQSVLTLEDFAKKEPTWEDIEVMSIELAKQHVAGPSFHEIREESLLERDRVNENMILLQEYFLLYEELTYSMNEGDIGRLESVFMPWVYIFRGCGKHKYATQLLKYLRDIHFKYLPFPGLRNAIRKNILCNPTGTPGRFRGIDWRESSRMSPLIETFKNVRIQVAKMFHLDHRTVKHSPAKLQTTFRALGTYLDEIKANEFVPGRGVNHSIEDKKSEGIFLGMTKDFKGMRGEDMEMEGDEGEESEDQPLGDEELEVEGEDGDLDV